MAGRFERREPGIRLVDLETDRPRRISQSDLAPDEPPQEEDFPPNHVVAKRFQALNLLDGMVEEDPTTTLYHRAKMDRVRDRLGTSYD